MRFRSPARSTLPNVRPRDRRLRTLLVAGTTLLLVASALTGAATYADEANTQIETGHGAITPEMQAEIDRVVAAGSTPVSARSSASRLVADSTRCAVFDAQRYCLGVGWTTRTQSEVVARLTTRSQTFRTTTRERTGDLEAITAMRQRARLSTTAREEAERAELTAAARSVAKVWLIRHEIQGVPLPADFEQDHPKAVGALARTSPSKGFPDSFTILKQKQVRPQNTTYYCGPAAMQMIAWGWQGVRRDQRHWARKLGTSTAGTSITDMVRMVNEATDYDDPERAGDYIVLDISDFTFDEWWTLMMKHIHDYDAPVVLHPVLLKQYFPYLDDDASGHFQVGRGFDQNAGGKPLLGFFEPWDQSRFNPTEPRIARTQWQSAYKSYRANQAHFQHNLGV